MDRTVDIDLARDFSPEPFGRYPTHGPASGQRFRVEFLQAPLKRGDLLKVDIDGVEGLSSSFLDEAFAGLVRAGLVSVEEFFDRVMIISTRDPSYIDDIAIYVKEATAH